MRNDMIKWIEEYSICQKIKVQKRPIWRDEIEHHFYHLEPLASLGYKHLVVVPYRLQANGLAERRITEVMKYLRLGIGEAKENWSHYLPLVQHIINYAVDESIGTQPAGVIFGDIVNCELPRTWES